MKFHKCFTKRAAVSEVATGYNDPVGYFPIESFQHTLENRPAALAWFLCALDYLEGAAREIVIAGPNPEALLRAVRGPFLPNKVLAFADGKTSIPLLEGRKAIDGKAAAYVCESFTCKRPVSTPEELSKLLKE